MTQEIKHITESTKMAFYQSIMNAAVEGFCLSNKMSHAPREFPGLYTIVLVKDIPEEIVPEVEKLLSESAIEKAAVKERFADQAGAARRGRPSTKK